MKKIKRPFLALSFILGLSLVFTMIYSQSGSPFIQKSYATPSACSVYDMDDKVLQDTKCRFGKIKQTCESYVGKCCDANKAKGCHYGDGGSGEPILQ